MRKDVVTIPHMGGYGKMFETFFNNLDINICLPPPTSESTIKWGCKHSSDMMCFPFKVTLGNFKEALDGGANILLMYDSNGLCRFKHYWKLQKLVLEQNNYEFKIYNIKYNFPFVIKKLNKNNSYIKIFIETYKLYKIIQKNDKQEFSDTKLNIGIIGEIFTCLDNYTNNDIINKLDRLGVNVYNTVTLTSFIHNTFFHKVGLYNLLYYEHSKKFREYLNKEIGGHGFENIVNLFRLVDKKIDGVIHLLPLSCMPETTIEPVIDVICKNNNVPLLRLACDEVNSEANVNTRVETFVELVKRRK